MSTKTITRAGKWGNSVGIRLSEEISKATNIRAGSSVSVRVVPTGVLVEPQGKEPTIKELLKRITPENRHGYAWEGMRPVGRELW